MAFDHFKESNEYQVIGAYFSPVSDAYAKPGLASWNHRVAMCELATQHSLWIMVDAWESMQPKYIRTALVLDHFDQELNSDGGCLMPDGKTCY